MRVHCSSNHSNNLGRLVSKNSCNRVNTLNTTPNIYHSFQSHRSVRLKEWLKKKRALIGARSESICQHECSFPKQLQELHKQLALCSLNVPRHVLSHALLSSDRAWVCMYTASINPMSSWPGLTSMSTVCSLEISLHLLMQVYKKDEYMTSIERWREDVFGDVLFTQQHLGHTAFVH